MFSVTMLYFILHILVVFLCSPVKAQDQNGDITIQSTNLKGWQGCNNNQKKRVRQAWEDAIYMAKDLAGDDKAEMDKLDFNDAAALEFLGPAGKLKDYQTDFREMFKKVMGWGQGSGILPPVAKWDIFMRCDDWQNACAKVGPSAMAYTENRLQHQPDGGKKPKSVDEHRHATPIINLCPGFFIQDSWMDKVGKMKNDKNDNHRLDINWWLGNTGKCFSPIN
jgi:hypothetical protein